MIIGYECSLNDGGISKLLQYFATLHFDYYVPWLSAISNNKENLPSTTKNMCINADELYNIAPKSIWEIELCIYPSGEKKEYFETYDQYVKSNCIACLIFYDCKLLDIYAKSEIKEDIYKQLCRINANQLIAIQDSGNYRKKMHI